MMQSTCAFGPIRGAVWVVILCVLHFGPFAKILNKYGKGNFASFANLVPTQRAYEIQCSCFRGDLRTSCFVQVSIELS